MPRVSLALFSLATVVLIAAVTFSVSGAGPTVHAATALSASQAASTRACTGPGSCAAAACHGSIRPVAGSRILQTEYTTWIGQERHARAAEVLSNPVSVRMAK